MSDRRGEDLVGYFAYDEIPTLLQWAFRHSLGDYSDVLKSLAAIRVKMKQNHVCDDGCRVLKPKEKKK